MLKEENAMNSKHDQNDSQVIRELTKRVSAASKQANNQGQPFVLTWRPKPVTNRWQVEDSGCGCGPID
jgi:ABC-type proline/glycine betaine transport system substrate-binding protein